MSSTRVGVGIIGVQPGRSWGAIAHIPALRMLRDRFTIAGLANSTAESGRRAAKLVGIDHAFDSVETLIASPEVHLVSICVKVPHHYDIARAVIAAGKHVVCEWPLALNTNQAADLAERARAADVVAIVGTQAVLTPAVTALARLRDEGTFGTLLSSTIVASGMTWGEEIEQRNAYLLDARNGATMLTIAVGHALSAAELVFGPIVRVGATLATRRETVRIRETGVEVPLASPDQVIVSCIFADGMPLSLHYRGGVPHGPGLSWEVQGSTATARVQAPSGLIEMTGLSLKVSDEKQLDWHELVKPVAESIVEGVCRLYDAAWAKIVKKEDGAPTFDDGVRLHELIDAIQRSADTGAFVDVDHHTRPLQSTAMEISGSA